MPPDDGGDRDDGGERVSPPADPAAANPYVDGETAADRGTEAGSLFDDEYRPGESGLDAGLIAGDSTDPVLVAGVGYPLLGDLALGTVVAYRVADWDLPGVAVADCSHTPIAAYQTVSEGDYRTVLLVGAEKRGGELNDGTPSADPGAIHEYAPDAVEMPGEQLTELVGQSAMGFNTLENVVVVTRALGSFPGDTRVVAVEPAYDSWGMAVGEFSDPVEEALDEVERRLLEYLDDALA